METGRHLNGGGGHSTSHYFRGDFVSDSVVSTYKIAL